MGGGGLRILPHKSWNVYNFKNRERVRRDEQQARIDAEEKRKRAEAAEQEARLERLRARAKKSHSDDDQTDEALEGEDYKPLRRSMPKPKKMDDEEVVAREETLEHVNFFKDLEEGKTKHGRNEERELEKKKELEAWQKKIGALTYLGQSVVDQKNGGAWYEKAETKPLSQEEAVRVSNSQSLEDPLNDMKEYVRKTERHHRKQEDRQHRKEKRRVSGRSHKKKRKSPSKYEKIDVDPKLLALRQARLRREKEEKQRVESLLRAAAAAETPRHTPKRIEYDESNRYRHLLDTPSSNRSSLTPRRHRSRSRSPSGRRSHSSRHR